MTLQSDSTTDALSSLPDEYREALESYTPASLRDDAPNGADPTGEAAEDGDDEEKPAEGAASTDQDESLARGTTAEGSAAQPGVSSPAPQTSWTDDPEVSVIASRFGFEPDEIQQFESRKDFDRHVAILNRRMLTHLRAAAAAEQPAGQPQQALEPAAAASSGQQPTALDAEIEKFLADEYVEESLKTVVRALYEENKQNRQARQIFIEQARQADEQRQQLEMDQFDVALSGWKNPLLGEDIAKLTPEQRANRTKVWETLSGLRVLEYSRTGVLPPASDVALLQQAFHANFFNQVLSHQRQQDINTLKAHDKRRLGTPGPTKARDDAQNDGGYPPDLIEMYHQLANKK